MSERPRFFDDIAGVAGGALSALSGLRDEAETLVRARVDETIRKLDLVRREELEAMAEMAANARTGQEAAEAALSILQARVAATEARLGELEARLSAVEARPVAPPPEAPGGGGPGMIA